MNENGYNLKLDIFEGPLAKLLQFIEERKLEITKISLGEVTNDFLKYLESIEEEEKKHPRYLTEFIWIASKLILIKSKELIPSLELSQDEESEIKELEDRLRIYKEFNDAKNHLKSLYSNNNISFSRKYLPPAFFFPPEGLKLEELRSSMEKFAKTLDFIKEPESAKINLVNFEEKLKELANRIKLELESSFSKLSQDKSKEEIVILFLAILHLMKDNLIAIKQDNQFSDILITSNEENNQTQ